MFNNLSFQFQLVAICGWPQSSQLPEMPPSTGGAPSKISLKIVILSWKGFKMDIGVCKKMICLIACSLLRRYAAGLHIALLLFFLSIFQQSSYLTKSEAQKLQSSYMNSWDNFFNNGAEVLKNCLHSFICKLFLHSELNLLFVLLYELRNINIRIYKITQRDRISGKALYCVNL